MIYSPWLDKPDPLILDTVTPAQIKRLKDRVAGQAPDAIERGRQNWERTKEVMRRLVGANVRIALGTDAGGMSGDQFIGWTAHTEIENMVAAGMTPMQALIACTRTAADVHALTDMGTVAAGRSADFVGAGCRSDDRHHQHTENFARLSARAGDRPRSPESEVGECDET